MYHTAIGKPSPDCKFWFYNALKDSTESTAGAVQSRSGGFMIEEEINEIHKYYTLHSASAAPVCRVYDNTQCRDGFQRQRCCR